MHNNRDMYYIGASLSSTGFSVLQDNHFLNIVISLLVDGEYTGMCVIYACMHAV